MNRHRIKKLIMAVYGTLTDGKVYMKEKLWKFPILRMDIRFVILYQ